MEHPETNFRLSRVNVPVKQMYGVFQVFRGGRFEQIGDLHLDAACAMWAHCHCVARNIGSDEPGTFVVAPVDVQMN